MHKDRIQIFHSLNSGIFLEKNGTCLAVDTIHEGPVQGMNQMSGQLLNELRTCTGFFARINALLFTHIHCDHFSKTLLEEYRTTDYGKTVPVYCPGYRRNTLPLTKITQEIDKSVIGPFTVYFLTTKHDAEKFRDVYHRAVLVQTEEENVFIAGDTLLQNADLVRIQENICTRLDTVILNPYQAIAPEGKKLLKEMDTRKILLYHIPEKRIDGKACTDHNAFRIAAKSVRRSWPDVLPQPLLLPQMTYADAVNA